MSRIRQARHAASTAASGTYDTSSHTNVASAAPRTAAVHPRESSAPQGHPAATTTHPAATLAVGVKAAAKRKGVVAAIASHASVAGAREPAIRMAHSHSEAETMAPTQRRRPAGMLGPSGNGMRPIMSGAARAKARPAASDATSTRATGHAALVSIEVE